MTCEETGIPITLQTDELRELGDDGAPLHIKAYPRVGDVTIKLQFWSLTNELYSGEFDLTAAYNATIHPLAHFSEPGEYTITLSLIDAVYSPVIDDVKESITARVVGAGEGTAGYRNLPYTDGRGNRDSA